MNSHNHHQTFKNTFGRTLLFLVGLPLLQGSLVVAQSNSEAANNRTPVIRSARHNRPSSSRIQGPATPPVLPASERIDLEPNAARNKNTSASNSAAPISAASISAASNSAGMTKPLRKRFMFGSLPDRIEKMRNVSANAGDRDPPRLFPNIPPAIRVRKTENEFDELPKLDEDESQEEQDADSSPSERQASSEEDLADPAIPVFRETYSEFYRQHPRQESDRFSSTIGAKLDGSLVRNAPQMSAVERVIEQSSEIAELRKQLAERENENKILKTELKLTIDTLNATNLAFNEVQTQLVSAQQENQILRIKFTELTELFAESETEVELMLQQLRSFVSKEITGMSMPRNTPPLVQPGAIPGSELLPDPR